MSLATSSGMAGGGASGGLVLAHQAVGHAAAPPQPPPQAATTGHVGPPPLLGADLSDKNQAISLKQVKNLSHLPLMGIDLHASEPILAYFPPKPEDPTGGDTPVLVGKMKPNLYLKASEASHKTLRKYLAKSKTFESLQADCITQTTDKDAVVLQKPRDWLGLRRLQDAPEFVRQAASTGSNDSKHAIAEEVSQGVGAVLVNSTLDGASEQTGDDFDRVVWKVRLCDSKKALTVLPEEAAQILLHQAQYHVAKKIQAEHEEEEIVDFPCAVALPAWAYHDAAVEALLEAMNTGVIVSRSAAALAGALLPPVDGGKPSALLERITVVRKASRQEFQKTKVQNPEAIWEDEVTLILVGMTDEGLECTAVQVSGENLHNACAIFGDIKVISNVSYQSSEPVSLMKQCATELETQVELIAPEADGPAGIVFYGTAAEQETLKKEWGKVKPSEWKKVPLINTKPDSIALGTAVLGAVSHGRSTRVDESDGGRNRAEMAIQVQNVAPVAVGVQLNYHGGAASKWTPVKTVFDFDRRVPAGPFALDLSAAECAVHKSGAAEGLTEEQLLKAIKENEGSKNIPKREEAALNLRVQVVQKWTRDGEWKPVGDVMKPLVITKDPTDETKQEACERIVLELSLGITGMISTSLVGERESVVQATTSARNSAIRYYVGIGLAILFFGGFMARSYWEEYVFRRDTERLLAYYKHVIPGSIHDGDEHNARYLVYKYRNKKERLWKLLEKKYGEPVLQVHDWPEYKAESEEEEETVNLDEETSGKQDKKSGDSKAESGGSDEF